MQNGSGTRRFRRLPREPQPCRQWDEGGIVWPDELRHRRRMSEGAGNAISTDVDEKKEPRVYIREGTGPAGGARSGGMKNAMFLSGRFCLSGPRRRRAFPREVPII